MFQPLEVEEALFRVLHHTVCAGGPFQNASDVYTEELEAFHLLDCGPVDVDGSCSLYCLLKSIIAFVDVKGEAIFLAPLRQGSHLLPVGCLVIVSNQAYYCCIVCKLDDSVGGIRGHTVMGEQGVEKGAEHAPLRGPCVEDQRSGGVVS